MKRYITLWGTAFLFAVLSAAVLPPRALSAGITVKPARDTIRIGTFYNGTTLEVTGTAPADAEVVLAVSGPRKEVHLKIKGKVGGLLWMNKSDVTLTDIPAVYLIYSKTDPASLLRAEHGVGYESLLSTIGIEPEGADKDFVFGEYVKLMEKARVYAQIGDSVEYGPARDGVRDYKVVLPIPPKMSEGDYTIEAVAISGDQVVARNSAALNLRFSGLPKLIAKLAFGKPLLFGIMSVFIAIATGLIIGMIFRGGGGAH